VEHKTYLSCIGPSCIVGRWQEQNGKIWRCEDVIKVKYHFGMMTGRMLRQETKIACMYKTQQGFTGVNGNRSGGRRRGLQ
jgi:hypothetical protein